MAAKSTGIDMEQNYVTVTLCIGSESVPLFLSFPLGVDPLNTARRWGSVVSSPSGVWGGARVWGGAPSEIEFCVF